MQNAKTDIIIVGSHKGKKSNHYDLGVFETIMNEIIYQRANIRDVDILTEMRIEVLRAANELRADEDMAVIKEESFYYYTKSLSNGDHTAYLVYEGECVVGCGGISYYRVMPTYHNPSGKRAYIMNLYVYPEYRRRGIATNLVQLLLKEACSKNVRHITLEVTGVYSVYEKLGFHLMKHEMEFAGAFPKEKEFALENTEEQEQDV